MIQSAISIPINRPPDASRPHMAVGKVKWFDATRGFGLSSRATVRSTHSSIQNAIEHSGLRALIDGRKVQYDIVPGMDGKAAAENLVILD